MPAHFEMFNQFITKFVEITEAELEDLNSKCAKVEFLKGSIIMNAGQVQKNLYFITKGIIRNYVVNNKGEIKIYNFR
jgi:signal-transduction protein with cAMP-binding, CBS, and nucleotidyltransferase domain